MTNDNEGVLARVWRALKSWEDAIDASPYDYVFARLSALENEIAVLKSELRKTTPPHAREHAN